MTEAPQEAKVQESQVFNMSEVPGEEDLRDAWGRPAEGDEDVDFAGRYDSMKGPELKAEVKRRQAEGREFDTAQLKTVRDVRSALEADDEAQAEEARKAAEDDKE